LLLEDAIEEFGPDHDFTKLCINHKGIDPDDAFSTVPYEKGFHMVYYLDRLVGRGNFDQFIPYYFTKFTNKSLDSYEFKDTFLEFFDKPEFANLKEKIAGIDWEGRFYSPGLPPKPEFDTSLIDGCYALAEKWKSEVSRLGVDRTLLAEHRLRPQAKKPGLHPERQRRRRLVREPKTGLPQHSAGLQAAALGGARPAARDDV
jgi:aminopeptidase N